jgi:hypothetical protein
MSLSVILKFIFVEQLNFYWLYLQQKKINDKQRGVFVRELLMCFEGTAVGLKLPEDGANKRQNVYR